MNQIKYDGPGVLYIADIESARLDDKSHLDRVITVCQDHIGENISSTQTYNYFCMSDGHERYGGDSSYDIFQAAVNELYYALLNDESVLIHCHVGKSRSVSVATAAIGRLLEIARYEAYDIVQHYRPQANPNPVLIGHAATYIEQYTDNEPLWSEYQKRSEE